MEIQSHGRAVAAAMDVTGKRESGPPAQGSKGPNEGVMVSVALGSRGRRMVNEGRANANASVDVTTNAGSTDAPAAHPHSFVLLKWATTAVLLRAATALANPPPPSAAPERADTGNKGPARVDAEPVPRVNEGPAADCTGAPSV